MQESLGNKATKGTIWSSVDRLSVIILQFVVNLILARLLMPDDFGAIGLITIFIAVAQTYNPQNEMFAAFETNRSLLKNETYPKIKKFSPGFAGV